MRRYRQARLSRSLGMPQNERSRAADPRSRREAPGQFLAYRRRGFMHLPQ
jgi:hypothetical protein